MTYRERVLALKFLEKQKRNPEYAKKLGVEVKMKSKKENRYENTSNIRKY